MPYATPEPSSVLKLWLMGSLSLLLVAGCGPLEADDLAQTADPIVNGQLDYGHPAVGRVATPLGGGHCTGTLIGQRTVLTAGHCVENRSSASFIVGGRRYKGSAAANPRYFQRPWYDGDVGVIRLHQAVAGIAPRKLCSAPPALGNSITIVGFGFTGTQAYDYGTKRWGQNTVARVTPANLEIQSGISGARAQVCYGDSGGAAFRGSCLLGVTSYGRGGCENLSGFVRVDANASWVKQTASDATIGQTAAAPAPACQRVCDKSGCRCCRQVCTKSGCRCS